MMLRVLQSDALPPFTGGRRAGTQAGTRTGTRQCGRASRGRWAASSIRARRRLMHRGAGEGPGQRRTAHVVACPGGPGCECWTSTPPPRRLQPNLPLRAANRADGVFGSHRPGVDPKREPHAGRLELAPRDNGIHGRAAHPQFRCDFGGCEPLALGLQWSPAGCTVCAAVPQ